MNEVLAIAKKALNGRQYPKGKGAGKHQTKGEKFQEMGKGKG